MIRFQCPHCRGIIATEDWEPGVAATCAYCGEKVTAPNTRFDPGAVIGDFLIIRKIGSGGMGIVFLAHQLSLDRPAAIKVLSPEYSQETESVKAFIREARSAAKLNHPNIVQAYAVGEDEGLFYFAMEYIDGQTMKQALQDQGRIPADEACRVIMQVADALDCAWKEQKLIHHDIKPDNIMRCGNNRIKLADLGLSQVFGEDVNTDSDMVVGTPQYISPEQLTGVVTDTRSDIYSLGATFYHLVTGSFPYNGENTDEIARQHLVGTLRPPIELDPLLPRPVNDIILKMMARSPANRYQNCEELSAALQAYLSGRSGNTLSGSMPRLNAGLGGNTPSGRLAQTLSGNSGTLGGGLSGGLGGGMGGASAQAKVLMPSSHTKLSLKLKPAESAAPEPAATPPEAQAPDEAAATKPESATETAARPAIALKLHSAAPEAEAPQTEVAIPEAADEDRNAAETGASQPEESDAIPEETLEPPEPRDGEDKSDNFFLLRATVIAVILLLLVLGGYWLLSGRNAAPPRTAVAPAPKPAPVLRPATPPISPAVKNAAAVPEAPAPLPVPQIEVPQISAFMREANRLQELLFANEIRFLGEFTRVSLRPETPEERKFLDNLEAAYIDCDERCNVAPARTPLIQTYRADIEKQRRETARAALQQRIAGLARMETERAESSDENYRADLPRKMELLDYLMIRAAKSGAEEDWNRFRQAIQAARQEPARVKDYPNRAEAALTLVDYARRLDLAAGQGRYLSEELKKNDSKLKGRSFEFAGGKATVTRTGDGLIEFQITSPDGKTRNERVVLAAVTPEMARPLVDAAGLAIGRGDQYFYYMLYNGELKNNLAFAAPDDFWRRRVNRVAEGFFRRSLLLSTPEEVEKLKQAYGSWRAFQRAEDSLR